jgi:hypothetical protein
MAFSRQLLPRSDGLDEKSLLSNFVGIGMNFAAKASKDPNIEDTVLAASIEGLENDDLRVLSVLTTWIEVHSAAINVDRLVQIVLSHPSKRVKAYWASIAMWQIKDRRFTKMVRVYSGPIIDLLQVGADFQIKRHGEDKRFSGALMRVAAGTLRDRDSDVLTPAQLARCHEIYRWRTIIGPTYRADMWAELEKNAKLSTAELARLAYGSFATAWKVRKDWSIVYPQAV